MKKFFIIILLFLVTGAYGQQVNAPEAKSFTQSTSGQDAGGFSLSGFNSTSTLLCAIGLPSAPSGTTFYLTTTTGLTASIGYSMGGNKTRLAFTGTMANINNALASLKINTTGTAGNIQISVSATVNPTGYYYLPTNGHFYKPVAGFTGVSGFSGTSITAYNNLKTYCTQQSFKGQTGYLMTITSADEDNFVYLNVPQSNIIFALTDNVTEGTFKIDAGPEAGTVVRIGATNQQGQYTNWAGGEPNNWGSGEDYVVTKWGGSQWNDYGPEATPFPGGIGGYVIEFGNWSNPDDATFTDFYSNSVNHSNGNILRAQFQYDFGQNLNETNFRTKLFSNYNNIQQGLVDYTSLNSLGKIDMTNGLDQTKISDGYKASINAGQVEYSYTNPNASWLGGNSRLLIDMRTFGSTIPSDVKRVSILDCYDGPVTFLSQDAAWAQYSVPSPLEKVTNGTSAYNSYIRNVNGWNTDYAFQSSISFSQNQIFKPHYSDVKYYGGNHSSLFSSIVTVSDVYLAFKQVSDNGLFGNSNVWFTTPIQFANADVDTNGVFNEQDCFILLKHLLGETTIWSNTTDLGGMAKFIKKSDYDAITNNNWQNYLSTSTKYDLPTILDGQLNSYNIAVTWKGDVNLSHSAIPTGVNTTSINSSANFVKSMSVNKSESLGSIISDIMMEMVGDVVEATISVIPNGNQIGATQFEVSFDNSMLEYVKSEYDNKTDINFARNNGNSIGIGTLNTSGNAIGKTGYKLTFKPKSTLTNILGLISVKNVETIDTNLNKLTIKIQ
jgi:hypothetical protein